MDANYGLRIKRGSGAVVNTFTQWGIACMKVPFDIGAKTKDLPKRNWYDEHGDDTYIPSKMMFEAYDTEFELACVVTGSAWNLSPALSKIDAFRKWLTGNDTDGGSGAELSIYSPYSTIGRQGCYLLDFSNEDPVVQLSQSSGNVYKENVVTFKVKFRITDPITNITL